MMSTFKWIYQISGYAVQVIKIESDDTLGSEMKK